MKRYYSVLFFVIIIGVFLAGPSYSALLQGDVVNPETDLETFGGQSGYDTADISLATRIGDIIQIILGFVGTLFLILIIWSGYQWMTAGGNSETIGKAKQRMVNAVIGLVIVLAAYAITWFVTTEVLGVTGITTTE